MSTQRKAIVYAILAAALYAFNAPASKRLIRHVDTVMMAAFLYLGAGIGLMIYGTVQTRLTKKGQTERLTRKELPYTIAMVLLGIAAPTLLMAGIARTSSANVSLLNNFESVATSVIALVIFKEIISRQLWLAIALVTIPRIPFCFCAVIFYCGN